jgi:hypothetical protein
MRYAVTFPACWVVLTRAVAPAPWSGLRKPCMQRVAPRFH